MRINPENLKQSLKSKDPLEELFVDIEGSRLKRQVVYEENPTKEQEIINEIYSIIAVLYQRNMFEADNVFFGYEGAIGFKIDSSLYDVFEPTLQKILSILHKKISIQHVTLHTVRSMLENLVTAIETFDPKDTEYLSHDLQPKFTQKHRDFLGNFNAIIKAILKKYPA